jgi:predicted PurR-regulated permease PerM
MYFAACAASVCVDVLAATKTLVMAETARRAFVATIVTVGVIVFALALWKLRLVVALLFAGFIVSAAMRPGIEALHRRQVPRSAGLFLHYAVFAGLIALVLWFAVPRALAQVTGAIENLPQTRHAIGVEAKQSSGIKQEILLSLQRRLKEVPSGHALFQTLKTIGMTAFEVGIGIFFVFAVAGYWIFERDRAMNVVAELLPREKRKLVRDTWLLIDLKLGAYVRGMALIILIVATTLSLLFWAIGLRYWLLIGCFAGLVEIVPVIGPLAAAALAVGVGLTESVHLAVLALVVVAAVRLTQDYLVNPRVMGGAVGMSPLLVLFSASAIVFLFGGFAVLLAVPLAAVLVTLVDVAVRDKDPADEETPTVLFPAAKEAER